MANAMNTQLIENADALFIGAGPVGLYTAIQAKLYQPNLNIVMLERHQTYVRHHILRIDASSYNGAHPNADFQALLAPLCGMVPTSTIETSLLNFAKKIGIHIVHEKVLSIHELAKKALKAQFIIGSDGAKSLMRKEMFNDEKSKDINLQYIVEVKYKAKGFAKALNTYDYATTHGQCDHFVRENIGKLSQGETPVSLFFFVDEAGYHDIQSLNTTPGQALGLMDINPHQSNALYQLSSSIRTWLAARRAATNETFVLGSEKIAAVALPVYSSKRFVTQSAGKTYLLIGDAAMGVPYFRALNAGLISANHAAKLISKKPLPKHPLASAHFASYSNAQDFHNARYQQLLTDIAATETKTALHTDVKINAGRSVAHVGRTYFPTCSASSMEPELLEAIQQARLAPPNVFLRHPRTSLAVIIWGIASIGMIICAPINMASILSISLCTLALIVATQLSSLQHVPAESPQGSPLPWEVSPKRNKAHVEKDKSSSEMDPSAAPVSSKTKKPTKPTAWLNLFFSDSSDSDEEQTTHLASPSF